MNLEWLILKYVFDVLGCYKYLCARFGTEELGVYLPSCEPNPISLATVLKLPNFCAVLPGCGKVSNVCPGFECLGVVEFRWFNGFLFGSLVHTFITKI